MQLEPVTSRPVEEQVSGLRRIWLQFAPDVFDYGPQGMRAALGITPPQEFDQPVAGNCTVRMCTQMPEQLTLDLGQVDLETVRGDLMRIQVYIPAADQKVV
jgi:hypothetical protein